MSKKPFENSNEDKSNLQNFSDTEGCEDLSNAELVSVLNAFSEDDFQNVAEILNKQESETMAEPEGERSEQNTDGGKVDESHEEIEREVTQDLENFRETWKERIDLDRETERKIISKVNEMKIRAYNEYDGSMVVEFELNGRRRRIINVNLGAHSLGQYKEEYTLGGLKKEEVTLKGMRGRTSQWDNKLLRKYVLEKEKENFRMPKKNDIDSLLGELGREAGLVKKSDQIAMLIYMTGMFGYYWLDTVDGDSRSVLVCGNPCGFKSYNRNRDSASMFLLN